MGNTVPAYEPFQYSVWRQDIPQLPGHTRELVNILNKDFPSEFNHGYVPPETIWT
jgi:hypothetical protein